MGYQPNQIGHQPHDKTTGGVFRAAYQRRKGDKMKFWNAGQQSWGQSASWQVRFSFGCNKHWLFYQTASASNQPNSYHQQSLWLYWHGVLPRFYTLVSVLFFNQSKYTLFERPLLLPWTGDGFDDSCTYEHTSLVAILQLEKCTPEAPVSSIAGFRGHHRSPIHDLQQVKKIVSKGRTSGKVNVRHRAYAELAARFISEHLGHK